MFEKSNTDGRATKQEPERSQRSYAGGRNVHCLRQSRRALGPCFRGYSWWCAEELISNTVDAADLPASSLEAMRAELRTLRRAEMQHAKLLMQKIATVKRPQSKEELLTLLLVNMPRSVDRALLAFTVWRVRS